MGHWLRPGRLDSCRGRTRWAGRPVGAGVGSPSCGFGDNDGTPSNRADRRRPRLGRRGPCVAAGGCSSGRLRGGRLTIGPRVPFCSPTVEDLDADRRVIEPHDVRSASWARVAMIRNSDAWTVRRLGPRRLWTELDTAYEWWPAAGGPTPDRYGVTMAPDGSHEVWIGPPEGARRWVQPVRRAGAPHRVVRVVAESPSHGRHPYDADERHAPWQAVRGGVPEPSRPGRAGSPRSRAHVRASSCRRCSPPNSHPTAPDVAARPTEKTTRHSAAGSRETPARAAQARLP